MSLCLLRKFVGGQNNTILDMFNDTFIFLSWTES